MGELRSIATSLNLSLGYEVSRETLFRTLLQELDSLYFDIKKGISPIQEWRESLNTLSEKVSVARGGSKIEGIAEDVDNLGNLIIRTDDGNLVTLTSGDVTLEKNDAAR